MGYRAVSPPSMTRSLPVTKADSSEARDSTPEGQHPRGHVLRLAEPPEGVAGNTPLVSLRARQHPGRHRGLDDSRMDGVTPYAFLGVLHGRLLGEKPHRPLESTVGGGL